MAIDRTDRLIFALFWDSGADSVSIADQIRGLFLNSAKWPISATGDLAGPGQFQGSEQTAAQAAPSAAVTVANSDLNAGGDPIAGPSRAALLAAVQYLSHWHIVPLTEQSDPQQGTGLLKEQLLQLLNQAQIASDSDLADPTLLLQKIWQLHNPSKLNGLLQAMLEVDPNKKEAERLAEVLSQIRLTLQEILVEANNSPLTALTHFSDRAPSHYASQHYGQNCSSWQPLKHLLTIIQNMGENIIADLKDLENRLITLVKDQVGAMTKIEPGVKLLLSGSAEQSDTIVLRDTVRLLQETVRLDAGPLSDQLKELCNQLETVIKGLKSGAPRAELLDLIQRSLEQLRQITKQDFLHDHQQSAHIGQYATTIERILTQLMLRLAESTTSADFSKAPSPIANHSRLISALSTTGYLFSLISELESLLNSNRGLMTKTSEELLVLLQSYRNNYQNQSERANTPLLHRMLALSQESLPAEKGQIHIQLLTNGQRKISTVFEQIWQTYETLNKLNVLSQVSGEPIFLFFPTVISGMLTRFEIAYQNHSRKRGTTAKNRGKKKDGYQTLELKTVLPNLGALGVNISFRQAEITMQVTCINEQTTSRIASALDKLGAKLHTLGYTEQELSCITRRPPEIKPDWLSNLVKSPEIIA